MRLIIIFFMLWILPFSVFSTNLPDENMIKQDLQQAQENKTTSKQREIVEALQSTLHSIADSKASNAKIKEYQKAIDDFPVLTRQLRDQRDNETEDITEINSQLSSNELNQRLLQVNSQLMDLTGQLQQEQDQANAISD